MQTTQKYVGRIASVPGNDGFGFIGLASVSKKDGTPHELPTADDVFLHREECGSDLKVGMTIAFDIVPDRNRGTGYYRAMSAVEFVETELLPTNEAPLPGFTGSLVLFEAPGTVALQVQPTLAQRAMKEVPPEMVAKALENKPAPTILRDSSVPPNKDELMKLFLRFLFPTMEHFGTAFSLEGDETELRLQLQRSKEDQSVLGMTQQIPIMEAEANRFFEFRGALSFMVRENLVRNDTIIPIKYLPDFFMAVPVWYFSMSEGEAAQATREWDQSDPHVHSATKYFCELFPNQNWADVFQMFNRRLRTLHRYTGDIIPPKVSRRIVQAREQFDYTIIMTPYLDVAGRDWQNPQWLRSIDPYVVGFKRGIPYFFVLARFSDSGTFPLFTEMVADTIGFLKTHQNRLLNFNTVSNPFWNFVNPQKGALPGHALGTHLSKVSATLINEFESGTLFDWLRGEEKPTGQ